MDAINARVGISKGRPGRPRLGRWEPIYARVPGDVHRALRASADARGITMNEIINQQLRGIVQNTVSGATIGANSIEKNGDADSHSGKTSGIGV